MFTQSEFDKLVRFLQTEVPIEVQTGSFDDFLEYLLEYKQARKVSSVIDPHIMIAFIESCEMTYTGQWRGARELYQEYEQACLESSTSAMNVRAWAQFMKSRFRQRRVGTGCQYFIG